MDRKSLQLPTLGHNQSVIRQGLFFSENVEHKSYAFKAKHIISVRRNLNLELRRFLFSINYGPFLIRGILVELDAKFET
jgi:hypothetical protein